MRYQSTRGGGGEPLAFLDVVLEGLARDGGARGGGMSLGGDVRRGERCRRQHSPPIVDPHHHFQYRRSQPPPLSCNRLPVVFEGPCLWYPGHCSAGPLAIVDRPQSVGLGPRIASFPKSVFGGPNPLASTCRRAVRAGGDPISGRPVGGVEGPLLPGVCVCVGVWHVEVGSGCLNSPKG